ncbi:MAG: hypothetical protein KME13_25980 [Myxacorys californica WJT36-NPBG1]|nr:hypothetical protein [Myxacorys californica WJT36-NPBG1]
MSSVAARSQLRSTPPAIGFAKLRGIARFSCLQKLKIDEVPVLSLLLPVQQLRREQP